MTKILAIFMTGLMLMSLVIAQEDLGVDEYGNPIIDNDTRASAEGEVTITVNEEHEFNGSGVIIGGGNDSLGNLINQTGVVDESVESTTELRVVQISEGESIIISGDVNATTELHVNVQPSVGTIGESEISVVTDEGNEVTIDVTPRDALTTALLNVGARCPENGNCEIELEAEEENNVETVIYDIEARKDVRFLGIFSANMPVYVQVDAESGNVVSTKRAWWGILSAGGNISANQNNDLNNRIVAGEFGQRTQTGAQGAVGAEGGLGGG